MARLEARRWEGDASGQTRRDRRPCNYEVYIPDPLLGRRFVLDGDVAADVADAEAALVRLDATAGALADTEALARLLLRAEAVASSRIEGLEGGWPPTAPAPRPPTSSARNRAMSPPWRSSGTLRRCSGPWRRCRPGDRSPWRSCSRRIAACSPGRASRSTPVAPVRTRTGLAVATTIRVQRPSCHRRTS